MNEKFISLKSIQTFINEKTKDTRLRVKTNMLIHVMGFINCQYSVAQMCTREDMLAHYLGAPFFDMS